MLTECQTLDLDKVPSYSATETDPSCLHMALQLLEHPQQMKIKSGSGQVKSTSEVTRTGTEGDKSTPKPSHGQSINTDEPKQNSFSHITMISIVFSFRKSIPNRILAKSNGYNS